MLPPILDVYVVWHPEDTRGVAISTAIVEHFHGTTYSGLLGGCIEIFVRSRAWRAQSDAPRPITHTAEYAFAGGGLPRYIAIVPILGLKMAKAVERSGPWRDYCSELARMRAERPDCLEILPCVLESEALEGQLGGMLGGRQGIAPPSLGAEGGSVDVSDTCRDLAQALTQMLAPKKRLTVFISHTKRPSAEEENSVGELVALVRQVILSTRLSQFFDASDLQSGDDWDAALRDAAGRSALLAVRTDLYSSRTWCQREMLIAKQCGTPTVIMDALNAGERRGSFIMDHVARVPVRLDTSIWRKADVLRALNLLVDSSLARELWRHQCALAQKLSGVDVAWWAPHAPEPLTLVNWLLEEQERERQQPEHPKLAERRSPLVILHPDPPLGEDERLVLSQIFSLAKLPQQLDLVTPRQLASRTLSV